MDPNETLVQLRAAIESGECDEVISLFLDLDQWLTRGGFKPNYWALP